MSVLSDEVRELNQATIDLLVSVGMMSSVMGRMHETVEDNFAEWVSDTRRIIETRVRECHQFGQAYDDRADGDDG